MVSKGFDFEMRDEHIENTLHNNPYLKKNNKAESQQKKEEQTQQNFGKNDSQTNTNITKQKQNKHKQTIPQQKNSHSDISQQMEQSQIQRSQSSSETNSSSFLENSRKTLTLNKGNLSSFYTKQTTDSVNQGTSSSTSSFGFPDDSSSISKWVGSSHSSLFAQSKKFPFGGKALTHTFTNQNNNNNINNHNNKMEDKTNELNNDENNKLKNTNNENVEFSRQQQLRKKLTELEKDWFFVFGEASQDSSRMIIDEKILLVLLDGVRWCVFNPPTQMIAKMALFSIHNRATYEMHTSILVYTTTLIQILERETNKKSNSSSETKNFVLISPYNPY
jgi:hypothetical protein